MHQPTKPQPDGWTNITLYVYRYTKGLPHGPWPRASNILKRALDLPHLLQWCPAFHNTRHELLDYTRKYVVKLPHFVAELLLKLVNPTSSSFCQVLLDCSVIPEIISLSQINGDWVFNEFFEVTRTWVFKLHRERLKRLHLWNAGKDDLPV